MYVKLFPLIILHRGTQNRRMHSSRSLLQPCWGTPAQQAFRPAINKQCSQTYVCVTAAQTGRRQQQQCHHRQQLQQRSTRRSLAPVASFFQDQFQDEEQQQPQPPSDPAMQQQPAVDTAAADWVFEHPSGVQVCVFGVEHLERQPHIGEFALMLAETAVVACACTLHRAQHKRSAGGDRPTASRPLLSVAAPLQEIGCCRTARLQWLSRRLAHPSMGLHQGVVSHAGTKCRVRFFDRGHLQLRRRDRWFAWKGRERGQ